VYRVS